MSYTSSKDYMCCTCLPGWIAVWHFPLQLSGPVEPSKQQSHCLAAQSARINQPLLREFFSSGQNISH